MKSLNSFFVLCHKTTQNVIKTYRRKDSAQNYLKINPQLELKVFNSEEELSRFVASTKGGIRSNPTLSDSLNVSSIQPTTNIDNSQPTKTNWEDASLPQLVRNRFKEVKQIFECEGPLRGMPILTFLGASREQVYTGFFDGSAKFNPGPAGAGYVLYDKDMKMVSKSADSLGLKTNNQAEYTALTRLLALAYLNGVEKLRVFGDSKLIINAMLGKCSITSPNLVEIYKQSWKLHRMFDMVHYEYIPRSQNTVADILANAWIKKIDPQNFQGHQSVQGLSLPKNK